MSACASLDVKCTVPTKFVAGLSYRSTSDAVKPSAEPAVVLGFAPVMSIRTGVAAPIITVLVSTDDSVVATSDTVAKCEPARVNARSTVRTPFVNVPGGGKMSVASVDVSCAEPAYDVATLPNMSSAVIVSTSASPADAVAGSAVS